MEASRFDRISKLFARRRFAMKREATPGPADAGVRPAPEFLFIQTYRAGAIAPKVGGNGRYILTLEAGTGQTVYFSDRPDRVVGATPTTQFLNTLGFPDDNPPNAALVVEDGAGNTDVAVIELFEPVYDPVTRGVTYEVEVLGNWQDELKVGLSDAPIDPAALEPSFGTAHLFIDGLLDCPNADIVCQDDRSGQQYGTIPGSWIDNFCQVTSYDWDTLKRVCVPCTTPYETKTQGLGIMYAFWRQRCQEMFPACVNCHPSGWCQLDPGSASTCPDYHP